MCIEREEKNVREIIRVTPVYVYRERERRRA